MSQEEFKTEVKRYYENLLNTDPNFSEFVESVKDKSYEEINKEYHLSFLD